MPICGSRAGQLKLAAMRSGSDFVDDPEDDRDVPAQTRAMRTNPASINSDISVETLTSPNSFTLITRTV